MWELRRLTTLWAFTACYSDSFTFPTCSVIEVSSLKRPNRSPPISHLRTKTDPVSETSWSVAFLECRAMAESKSTVITSNIGLFQLISLAYFELFADQSRVAARTGSRLLCGFVQEECEGRTENLVRCMRLNPLRSTNAYACYRIWRSLIFPINVLQVIVTRKLSPWKWELVSGPCPGPVQCSSHPL
jgi:hypothetical protein